MKKKPDCLTHRYFVFRLFLAHRIKNENSSLSIGVRTIKTQLRMLITGTPLQVSDSIRYVSCIYFRRFYTYRQILPFTDPTDHHAVIMYN